MRWASTFALVVATSALLVSCGDGQPKQLREATAEDLPSLVLQDGDAGPSYEYIDRGISRDVTFVPASTSPAADGTICINDNAQLATDDEAASESVDWARETVSEEVEILHPSGLVDDALAYHFVDDTPLCPGNDRGAAHGYFITFSRSNVLCFLAVFTSEEQGPELAVSLANKQVERIEAALADD